MIIQERSYSATTKGYRFAFNGKEQDDEGLGGGGSTYDYGFRIYNPALGKFLSVDPLFKSYPWYTPYQFAGNKPIAAIDLDGLEEFIVIDLYSGKHIYETILFKVSDINIIDENLLALNVKMTVKEAQRRGIYKSKDARLKWNNKRRIKWLYNRRGSKRVTEQRSFSSFIHKSAFKALDLKSFSKTLHVKKFQYISLEVRHSPDKGVDKEDYKTEDRTNALTEMLDYLVLNPDASIEVIGNASSKGTKYKSGSVDKENNTQLAEDRGSAGHEAILDVIKSEDRYKNISDDRIVLKPGVIKRGKKNQNTKFTIKLK